MCRVMEVRNCPIGKDGAGSSFFSTRTVALLSSLLMKDLHLIDSFRSQDWLIYACTVPIPNATSATKYAATLNAPWRSCLRTDHTMAKTRLLRRKSVRASSQVFVHAQPSTRWMPQPRLVPICAQTASLCLRFLGERLNVIAFSFASCG